jgi:hypothetical protein
VDVLGEFIRSLWKWLRFWLRLRFGFRLWLWFWLWLRVLSRII